MTGKQSAVLWIGLILIGLNLTFKWAEIKAIIFSGSGSVAGQSVGSAIAKGVGEAQAGLAAPNIGSARPVTASATPSGIQVV